MVRAHGVDVKRRALASAVALVLLSVFSVVGAPVFAAPSRSIESASASATNPDTVDQDADLATFPAVLAQAISDDSDEVDGTAHLPIDGAEAPSVFVDDGPDSHTILRFIPVYSIQGTPFRLAVYSGRAPPLV